MSDLGPEHITLADEYGRSISALQERVNTLFAAIAHGDDVHRAWLSEALACHFDGRPVPPPRTATIVPEIERLRDALRRASGHPQVADCRDCQSRLAECFAVSE